MPRYHAALLLVAWICLPGASHSADPLPPSVAPRAAGDKTTGDKLTGDKLTGDRAKLQGVWRAVETISNGTPNPPAHGLLFTFSGDTLTIKYPDVTEAIRAQFTIDETKTPKEIEWSGKFQGKAFVVRAIYKLDGDKLVYCSAQRLDPDAPPPPRPKVLRSAVGDKTTLNTLVRVREPAAGR
jgi:uncharacterized protein (TIGR03067 family)